MIVCYYTEVSKLWGDEELKRKLVLLPPKLQEQALNKKQWTDRQLCIAGKLLLIEVLKKFGLNDSLSLNNIIYNTYHRPFFDIDFDFNIAHSGNMVICCGTDTGKIGVDIEQVKQINLADYSDYFNLNEWAHIHTHLNILDGFYKFWTRKEAVLKAIGTGFYTPLTAIDVSQNTVGYNSIDYHLQSLNIHAAYQCHIANTVNLQPIHIIGL